MEKLKMFVCYSHNGVWLGGTSVVVAKSKRRARVILNKALKDVGLKPSPESPYDLEEVSLEEEYAYILNNGDY